MSAQVSRQEDLPLDGLSLGAAGAAGAARATEPASRQAAGRVAPAPGSRRLRPLARFTGGEEGPSFYLSLSDLMSLLLVFFVLIFSLTEVGAKSAPAPPLPRRTAPAPGGLISLDLPGINPFGQPARPAARVLPLAPAAATPSPAQAPAAPPAPVKQARQVKGRAVSPADLVVDQALLGLITAARPLPPQALPAGQPRLSQLLAGLEKKVRQAARGSGVAVSRGGGRLTIELPEAVTFDLGRAEIKPAMRPVIRRLGRVLASRRGYRVLVTGHTDDLPIANRRFASNWELSAARAAAVGRALLAQGLEPGRLTIRGLADQRPRVPNDSPAHRARNRRVEIELSPLKPGPATARLNPRPKAPPRG